MFKNFYSNKILYHGSYIIGFIIVITSLYTYRSLLKPLSLIGYILICMPLIYKSIIDYEKHNKISTMLISTAIISSIITSIVISSLIQIILS